MFEITAVDIRRAAMDLLARREHTLQELKHKLIQKFSLQLSRRHVGNIHLLTQNSDNPPDEDVQLDTGALVSLIDREVSRLTEEKLQSDDRFVESFINSRKSKGHGPQRILRDLKHKGVSHTLIAQYLDARDEQWVELARSVMVRKFGTAPASDYKEKAKRISFMQQRGFSVWMVEDVLLGLED